jgi:hypothetical protein
MTAAELLSVFDGDDRRHMDKIAEIQAERRDLRFDVETALLAILRDRTGDRTWYVWPGGNRPRFIRARNGDDYNQINLNGDRVVWTSRAGKRSFASLEEAADAIREAP